ncbi:Hypothetical predicted protein [Podarcis lilfordi]|uniref:Uncharacterized protein n=1 Tax=Podarcis lilfordi TaxID=74358 RepID=A0AA35KM77_9SAUR|nr:Hypothetical predicted protein [Podarcis lilfordi]
MVESTRYTSFLQKPAVSFLSTKAQTARGNLTCDRRLIRKTATLLLTPARLLPSRRFELEATFTDNLLRIAAAEPLGRKRRDGRGNRRGEAEGRRELPGPPAKRPREELRTSRLKEARRAEEPERRRGEGKARERKSG